ncbi:MAG: TonB-dependent receptor [Bacteroidales bacterium]|uniref:TonB-dependent receptor n=1 Tax=Porphyromonas sp. TaxID=1924944 RepID=UPI0029723623|nr:TonB-dependent receptor [Porphyromonas sp.]MDD7438150.1 TonB-dependent receptor [Bacteroidales bacterium]MDY3066797.1 TonB-dependent receptor [Porphyromonas sp.]
MIHIHERLLLVVSILLLLTVGDIPASAQEQGLRLQVVDEEGFPLPGVTVRFAERGTVSDPKGTVTIPTDLSHHQLITFSYIGFENQSFTLAVLQALSPRIVRMQPAQEQLHELVVTAESNPIRREAVGQNISALSLHEGVGSSLGEVLEGLRGVSLITTGTSASKPVIHGLHGNRILILNNGVRHTSQQWSNSHAPEIEIAQAGRISVLKGAESVRYGADALGGVILVEQRALPYHRESLVGEVTPYFQSNGLGFGVSAGLEHSFGKQGEWAWRLQGDYANSGDKRSAKYLLNNTGHRAWSGQGAIGLQNARLQLELFMSHLWEKEGVFFGAQMGNVDLLRERIEAGRPAEEVITPFTRHIDYGFHKVAHTLVKLEGHYHIDRYHTLRSQVAYQRNQRDEYHLRRNKLSAVPEMALVLHNVQGELQWRYNGKRAWSAEAGWLGRFTNNYNTPGTGVVPMIPNYTEGGIGGYALGKYSRDHWGVESGVRLDGNRIESAGINYDSEPYGGVERQFNITYTLGGYAELAKGLTLRSQLGTAWRSPHVAELYSNGLDQESGIYVVGQEKLKSERALKWIASLGYSHEYFQLDVEGYLQWIDHYIYQEPTGGVHRLVSGAYPLFRYRQTSATLHGVDAEATISPFSWLSYDVSAEMIWAAERSTGRYLPFIPPLRIGQELKVDFARGYIALEHKYVAEQKRFDPDTDLISFAPPAYHLFGLRASYEQPLQERSKLTYTFSVENLLNREYKEYTSRARYYAHDLGINARFAVRYQF